MWLIGQAFRRPPAVRPGDLYKSLSLLFGISRFPADVFTASVQNSENCLGSLAGG